MVFLVLLALEKSSLIYLILQSSLKPSSGNIFLGDDNFNKIDNKSLRSKIGFVSQDISLFHGTIIENVILSENKNNKNLGKIKNNIKKSLSLAGCSELFERLEFDVGENGRRLSGGQRQRLSIAREIYKNPQLFIFDEATSSLDLKSESVIKETIKKLKNQKTIIIISHKISLLENCDNIIVINKGEIVQNDTFKRLTKKRVS